MDSLRSHFGSTFVEGGVSLPAYRLYQMDGDGHFSTAEWIEADDDDSALAAARAAKAPGHCELWQSDRLVGRIDPSDPSDAEA